MHLEPASSIYLLEAFWEREKKNWAKVKQSTLNAYHQDHFPSRQSYIDDGATK